MNKIILILMAIVLNFSLRAEICGKGEITYFDTGKKISNSLSFCFDKDERSEFIYSKDCSKLKCKVLQNPKDRPVALMRYKSSIGSPGFKVCRELGGTPQIVEFSLKQNTGKLGRCIFTNQTFVSNDLLMKLWKGFIIK
ncbi:hypothetical protein [Bacteriovorax sp. Seq25_V]|uniref:hypothetical protein n=1 Tax=Bacteriovorax sp. Seq25_V TaxID=1201288 RepID=UPI000389EF3D|nr:hypothetical protein [Bacteriovorax sp. Seq25_V]EQC47592.1 hypothetical protein M900_0800 [Bacteriovorax sp. Seq25_V]